MEVVLQTSGFAFFEPGCRGGHKRSVAEWSSDVDHERLSKLPEAGHTREACSGGDDPGGVHYKKSRHGRPNDHTPLRNATLYLFSFHRIRRCCVPFLPRQRRAQGCIRTLPCETSPSNAIMSMGAHLHMTYRLEAWAASMKPYKTYKTRSK